jgi:hypothetical protein
VLGRPGNNGELETVVIREESRPERIDDAIAASFGISVAFGLAVWGAVARQYIWPALRDRPGTENLKPILLLHASGSSDYHFSCLVLFHRSYLLDLLNRYLLFGFYQGALISLPNTPGLLDAGYFILFAYVPLLLITHGLAFRILLRTRVAAPSRSASAQAVRWPLCAFQAS